MRIERAERRRTTTAGPTLGPASPGNGARMKHIGEIGCTLVVAIIALMLVGCLLAILGMALNL